MFGKEFREAQEMSFGALIFLIAQLSSVLTWNVSSSGNGNSNEGLHLEREVE